MASRRSQGGPTSAIAMDTPPTRRRIARGDTTAELTRLQGRAEGPLRHQGSQPPQHFEPSTASPGGAASSASPPPHEELQGSHLLLPVSPLGAPGEGLPPSMQALRHAAASTASASTSPAATTSADGDWQPAHTTRGGDGVLPNSFDLEHETCDWESRALVPWAMHLPRNVDARDIEELLPEKLHLQRGDITVMLHQLEPYLIRFESAAHTAEARWRGRFTRHDIDICLQT